MTIISSIANTVLLAAISIAKIPILVNGVVADDATRTSAEEIETHLEALMPEL